MVSYTQYKVSPCVSKWYNTSVEKQDVWLFRNHVFISFENYIINETIPFVSHQNLILDPCQAGSFFGFITPVYWSYYNGVIMRAMASQITSLAIVYSNFYSNGDHRKHQSSASLAFVRGIHPWPQMASNAENVSNWWRHHDHHPMQ